MPPEIPQAITEITPQWLTEQLTRREELSSVEVNSFDHTLIGVGQGNNGDIFQLQLQYSGSVQGPQTLVLKLPAASGGLFEPERMNLLNTRETSFYNELEGHVGMRVPKIYLAVSDTDLNRHLILMEDLSVLRDDAHQDDVSPEIGRLGVRALGNMHANWWNDPRLPNFDWIDNFAQSTQFSPEYFSKLWSSAKSRHAPEYGEYAVRFGDALEEKLARVLQHLGSAPVTLNHGDPRPANMFFDSTVSPPQPVLFDWQRPTMRRGAADLAQYISRGVRHSNDISVIEGLIDLYHTELTTGGVTGYSPEQLAFDFRLGLLIPFIIMAFNASRKGPDTDIADTMIPIEKDLPETVNALTAVEAL